MGELDLLKGEEMIVRRRRTGSRSQGQQASPVSEYEATHRKEDRGGRRAKSRGSQSFVFFLLSHNSISIGEESR